MQYIEMGFEDKTINIFYDQYIEESEERSPKMVKERAGIDKYNLDIAKF